jgi:hypothetical protein
VTYATLLERPVARKTPPPTPETPEPPSETARIAGDLMEMMRKVCFNTKDSRGKRLKLAQLIDNLLRPAVLREYNRMLKESE